MVYYYVIGLEIKKQRVLRFKSLWNIRTLNTTTSNSNKDNSPRFKIL